MEDCNRYGKRTFWLVLPMVLMLVCSAPVMAIQVDEFRPPKGSEIGKEIEEAQLHIGTIKFAGDSLGNREELLAILKSKSGAPLNRQLIRRDIQALIDFYDVQGYAFADVQPQLTRSTDPTRIDLTVTIDKGELTYIRQIHLAGNQNLLMTQAARMRAAEDVETSEKMTFTPEVLLRYLSGQTFPNCPLAKAKYLIHSIDQNPTCAYHADLIKKWSDR